MDATGRDIRDHQRWSVRDHIRCIEEADEQGLLNRTGVEPVPVIQGRDADDYLWHLDYMREHGLLCSSVVCIGSLVNRTPQEALSITERVRNALPSKYELHGMGLKKSHMNSVDAFEFLDSVDSTVWNFSNMKRCGGDNQTDNWIDNLEAYVSYRNQLEAVFSQRGSSSQTFSSGFADFLSDPKEMLGDSRLPLSECQCGALVDPNAFADGREDRWITGSGCRHCERLKNRLEMAVLGHLPPKNRYSEVLDESGDEVSPS